MKRLSLEVFSIDLVVELTYLLFAIQTLGMQDCQDINTASLKTQPLPPQANLNEAFKWRDELTR